MRTVRYRLTTAVPGVRFKAAVVADLHDRPYARVLPILARERPDCVLAPGDLTERLDGAPSGDPRPGLDFLREAAAASPVFYSLGNHETGAIRLRGRRGARWDGVPSAWREAIGRTGAILLDEGWTVWRGMAIGGLGSGLTHPDRKPDLSWLGGFTRFEGYRILLCHHPEYYDRFLRDFPIDLIVSGHAHGGQWRIFGRGVYAPDQPLFSRYMAGVHENRLVISRGAANSVPPIPRLFNPCEVVLVTVETVGTGRPPDRSPGARPDSGDPP